MCCKAKRARREAAALEARRIQAEAVLKASRAHEDALLNSRATYASNAHEAAFLQIAKPYQQPSSRSSEGAFHDERMAIGQPPAYGEVMAEGEGQKRPQVSVRGRNSLDDGGQAYGSEVDIATLPADHPVHRYSSCKIRTLRAQGVDPVMKAELEILAIKRYEVGFWSRLYGRR